MLPASVQLAQRWSRRRTTSPSEPPSEDARRAVTARRALGSYPHDVSSAAERFSFVRELGRGGMGAVQLVIDAERGERVALKRAQHVSPEAFLRFKREFRAVERLTHPALVRLHELGQDSGGLYLDPLETWRRLELSLERGSHFRVCDSIYASFVGAQRSLAMAVAARAGDRSVSIRALRRHAKRALGGVPVLHLPARRALAYAEDVKGRPEHALQQLELAEREATEHGRPIDLAIARHQRGRRLGGDEGRALMASAAAVVGAAGGSSRVLDEDPA